MVIDCLTAAKTESDRVSLLLEIIIDTSWHFVPTLFHVAEKSHLTSNEFQNYSRLPMMTGRN